MAALRFALVGCGRIAEYHYRAVQTVKPSCCVTAFVDIDREAAEAMKKKTGEGESCKVSQTGPRRAAVVVTSPAPFRFTLLLRRHSRKVILRQ